ncbi:MAG: FIST C-terminal domain-containing protein [Melioribacteraceae bacterium]|nr:FIST C-terminal domain-containing protein [Melioribacteraceae bacterium]MCF8353402.1 FIST C-terminal domain-containing protein [Melioribacteraceae bacterium]MCF8393019.1 FIST C-terminal domain-containing protein [Melioribacteraceae bacterium]MCF8419128.1 FIST C-terminal domain-containing protein [Melioribacteraceae bacterium]
MQIEQKIYSRSKGWSSLRSNIESKEPHLIIIFGNKLLLRDTDLIRSLKNDYNCEAIIGCSTAGEIHLDNVSDNSLVVNAIHFNNTKVECAKVELKNTTDSYNAGVKLAKSFPHQNLKHVFVLSDGININGSNLVYGIADNLPANVNITGGLSADEDKFKETVILMNDQVESKVVVGVGFYGDNLKVSCGSFGGWDPFGPERIVTKSEQNIVYEFDGKPSLELYKKYLGEYSKDLPASGLLFPLSIRLPDGENRLVRTILSIDENNQSMIFAGNVPQGSFARLMKANFDRLLDGAVEAANTALEAFQNIKPQFMILISCVGRKLILKQRVDEEIEGVKERVGPGPVITGFYSYGEIAPFKNNSKCELHNQTMTITAFAEQL